MELKEAKVIITGGTSGIGYETADMLKQMGAEVVICGTDEHKISKIAKELGVHGIKAGVTIEKEVIASRIETIQCKSYANKSKRGDY